MNHVCPARRRVEVRSKNEHFLIPLKSIFFLNATFSLDGNNIGCPASQRAIQVNIQIMRTFTKLREILVSNKDLARRLDELEKKYDKQFKIVFEAIRQLMAPPETTKRKIGFHLKEKQVRYGKKGAGK